MAEVKHTCPHCGHGVGRLMRVKGEGVSSCASCHKSDWSRRFPFPEPDAVRAQREAREARREQFEAVHFDSLSSDEESANDEFADDDGFTLAERRQQEHEDLIQRVRDEESMRWAKGVVIGFLALLVLIVWSRASGNERGHPDDPTCQYVGRSMECW
ncbi:hypothetical protein [Streptomyces griseiscabiei]|uniref:Uncharacterized protein n=1 Tax=Streptomyces griseiscabiei TaxID=2993540 RepID=A0ABU4LGP1_9ACTN|nr:hypothetical protein [Streptomyces griseiscabiei]MBZ3908197.1 hypothetical protein [Streptomyces griseiscabiei]MDX2914960.1 hypothetical protein [Streptomyces griseiscabiei]